MKEKDDRVPFTFALALSVVVLSGCDSESQLEADANALCNAFDPEYLKGEYEGMWLSDVEMAVYDNLGEAIETEEIKSLIAGRSDINNYSQVYPFIKERIEDALGASWSCQDMAAFYDISFVPATSGEETEVLELRQVDGLVFSMDDVVIDFSEAGTAAKTIEDNFGNPESVAVHFSGSGQDVLPQVLEVMTEIGVQNVNSEMSVKLPEVHTTMGNLEKWVVLPAQPNSVRWSTEPAVPATGNSRLTVPGPTDYGLTALLHFSQEDYDDIVRNSERVNEANDVVVNPEFYEAWVPEDVKAQLETKIHADGESIIMIGHPPYQANLFVNREGGSPLIHGSIQPLGKGYIVVSLYTM